MFAKSGLSPYDPGERSFPRKTSALFISQSHWVILWKQSDYCWLIIKLFLSFLPLSALPLMRTNITTSESWQTPLALSRSDFRRMVKLIFFCDKGINKNLRSIRRGGVYLDTFKKKTGKIKLGENWYSLLPTFFQVSWIKPCEDGLGFIFCLIKAFYWATFWNKWD